MGFCLFVCTQGLTSSSWPWTHWDPPVSSSQVLGLMGLCFCICIYLTLAILHFLLVCFCDKHPRELVLSCCFRVLSLWSSGSVSCGPWWSRRIYHDEREWQNKVAHLMVARKQRSKQIIRTRSKLLFRSLPRGPLPTAGLTPLSNAVRSPTAVSALLIHSPPKSPRVGYFKKKDISVSDHTGGIIIFTLFLLW